MFIRATLAFGSLALVLAAVLYATDERPEEKKVDAVPPPDPVSDKQVTDEAVPAPAAPAPPSVEMTMDPVTTSSAPLSEPELTMTPSDAGYAYKAG